MKCRYIVWGICFLACLYGCEKEEQLYPLNSGMTLRFDFPQGDASWDKELQKIAEIYATTPIYKDFDTTDLTRSWVTSVGSFGPVSGEGLDDEMAPVYVDFFKNHVFAFLKPELANGVLPNYFFLVNNLRKSTNYGYNQLSAIWDGMDFWAFSLNADSLPDLYAKSPRFTFPKTPWEYKVVRGRILQNIMKRIVQKGKISVPEEFEKDFDYSTEIKSQAAYQDDPNYYMQRGFCGQFLATSFERFTTYTTIGNVNPEVNFISYMHLGMRFSRDSVEIMYSTDKYPKVLKYYDFTVKYMKDHYDWDLTEMEKQPVIKEN